MINLTEVEKMLEYLSQEWTDDIDPNGRGVVVDEDQRVVCGCTIEYSKFIAASRTLVPELSDIARESVEIISDMLREIESLDFYAMDIVTSNKIKRMKSFLERVKP